MQEEKKVVDKNCIVVKKPRLEHGCYNSIREQLAKDIKMRFKMPVSILEEKDERDLWTVGIRIYWENGPDVVDRVKSYANNRVKEFKQGWLTWTPGLVLEVERKTSQFDYDVDMLYYNRKGRYVTLETVAEHVIANNRQDAIDIAHKKEMEMQGLDSSCKEGKERLVAYTRYEWQHYAGIDKEERAKNMLELQNGGNADSIIEQIEEEFDEN